MIRRGAINGALNTRDGSFPSLVSIHPRHCLAVRGQDDPGKRRVGQIGIDQIGSDQIGFGARTTTR